MWYFIASKKTIWLTRKAEDLSMSIGIPVLGCDSSRFVYLAKSAILQLHLHTELIACDISSTQDLEDGQFILANIKIQNNPADVLTKCLAKAQHELCRCPVAVD